MNTVMFQCTSLTGTNKVGNLKKTPEGYYEMIVGGLNVFNSGGQFYPLEGARQLFEDQSSALQRRVKRGALRGEYGHPKPPPRSLNPAEQRLRDEEFVRRNLTIDELNVTCHHMKLWLDFDRVKDAKGKPVISIMSHVAPNGPLGHVLEKQLMNPHENVCFSIRSFTENKKRFGVENRILKEVVTFDYVNEPGIATAEKYLSPALEHYSMECTRRTLERAVYSERDQLVATESVILTMDSLFASMGWDTPNQNNQPASLRW